MGPPDRDGAPREEPLGTLEQVGSLKPESTEPFGEHGAPGDRGPLNVGP